VESGALFLRSSRIRPTLLAIRENVAIRGPREILMVKGHTWTERGKCVACWSGFPLQGVHRFKSLLLSDMSNHLFAAVST
jgi:hypothetical protein